MESTRFADDATLTGRTTLSGDIAKPRRAWSLRAAEGGGQGEKRTSPTQALAAVGEPRFTTSLLAMRHDGTSGMDRLGQVDGLVGNPETLALTTDDRRVSALVRLQLPMRAEATLTCMGTAAQVVSRTPLGTGPFTPIAARTRPGGPMCIYTEGAAEQLLAVRPPTGDCDSAEVVWRRSGRGMGDQAAQGGPVAIDLDSDGAPPEVVAATATHSGAAALVDFDGDGQVEIASRGYRDGVRAIDPLNGNVMEGTWPSVSVQLESEQARW